MTNHWKDIRNTDVILVMGANPAENHPCGFKWAVEARDKRLAKMVVIDPRFTRTAAVADQFVQIRPGTDIAVLGGLVNYILEHKLYHEDYVRLHTNATFVVGAGYGFEDGIFSGFDEATNQYDQKAWGYEMGKDGFVVRDPAMQNPRSVFQLLKKHFSRYTPEIVERIAGCPKEKFIEAAKVICSTGTAGRVGTIMYAVGWTQHTTGSQNIRTAAIMQLLLGNIGRPGGGINALRGHANVQGATDHALVSEILPGYLRVPVPAQDSFAKHAEAVTPKPLVADTMNYLGNYSKFYVSQMKAWFGDHCTAANDWAYHYMGKPAGDSTWLSCWDAAYQGKLEGFITLGFNPLLAGPDIPRLLKSMARLKWKVVIDPFMLDSAEFWKAPGMKPEEIETEVLYLPATHWIERDGSFTNSGRWVQWKEKAIDPPPGVRSDTWIVSDLFWRVKELYQKEGGAWNDPIQHLTWNYVNPREPTMTELAREINGYDLSTGKLLDSFAGLKDDGTTTSGNWIYCGSFTEAGNMMARRGTDDPTGMAFHHNWAWNWPLNRRVLYNRASADEQGKPWDPHRPGIQWNGTEWIGDVPDYGKTMPPGKVGAFIMTGEGVARLYAPYLKDGPLPEHYEPVESPTVNVLHERVPNSPPVHYYDGVKDSVAKVSGEYPYPCTVYRVVEREHFVTSNVPYLVESMPDFFVELPEELAKEKGIANGAKCRVWSKRGEVTGTAIVTKRIKPLMVNGKATYTVGIPVHWGFVGITQGGMANMLTPFVGDVNTRCPEFKAFLVNVDKA